jgi:hypothetical protein
MPDDGSEPKCTPAPGVIGPLTPNVIYHYGLANADDFDQAREDCTAIQGTFETL